MHNKRNKQAFMGKILSFMDWGNVAFCGTVAQVLALLPHSKKVMGSIPAWRAVGSGGQVLPRPSVLRWAISRAFLCWVCMFSPCSQGVSSTKNPNRKTCRRTDHSPVRPWPRRTDHLTWSPGAIKAPGCPGGRTVQGGKMQSKKIHCDLFGLRVCVCVLCCHPKMHVCVAVCRLCQIKLTLTLISLSLLTPAVPGAYLLTTQHWDSLGQGLFFSFSHAKATKQQMCPCLDVFSHTSPTSLGHVWLATFSTSKYKYTQTLEPYWSDAGEFTIYWNNNLVFIFVLCLKSVKT